MREGTERRLVGEGTSQDAKRSDRSYSESDRLINAKEVTDPLKTSEPGFVGHSAMLASTKVLEG